MKKFWKLTFILISLIFLSVFFHLPLINWSISNEYLSVKDIHYLEKINKSAFHSFQYQNNNLGTSQWLTSSQYLARNDSNVALALANYHFSLKQIKEAMLWYKQALTQGNANAAQPLAEYWFEEGLLSQSLSLANKYNEHFWAQQLIVNIAMVQGNLSAIYTIESMLAESSKGQSLLTSLNKYQIINKNNVEATPQGSSCLTMQLFATSLNDLIHTSKLINQVENTEVGGYFCFNTPKYIPINTLACQYSPDQAIRCNEAIWDEYYASLDTRYLGVLLPSGGANVHSGILYLDSNDDVNVFKHELLHLLGFIDEYPLPIDHPFCQSVQDQAIAHNIVVLENDYQGTRENIRQQILNKTPWGYLINASTPILYKTLSGWQVGTPKEFENKIGLFPVTTCQNSQFISVKPLIEQTTLTYFELSLPQEYKNFLRMNSQKYIMPSFHYNVVEALEKEGNKMAVSMWLHKANLFNH